MSRSRHVGSYQPQHFCGCRNSHSEQSLSAVFEQVLAMFGRFMGMLEGFISNNPPTPTPTPTPAEPPTVAPTQPAAPSSPDGVTNDGDLAIKEDFVASMGEILNRGKGQTVHEERLQYGLAAYILGEDVGVEAKEAFTAAFKRLRKKGTANAGENAVKDALKSLVADGTITQSQAEKVNGLSFKAAQLDDNHEMLYDGRGSTSAKMGFNRAMNRAWKVLDAVQRKEGSFTARDLNAPSTPLESSSAASSIHGSSGTSGSGGFLWKPVSESDGRLVVLLPGSLRGQLKSVAIYDQHPDNGGRQIERGRFSGDTHNGGRPHYRFDRAGSAYPDGVYVVAKLRDGRQETFQINDSASRNTL